MLLSIRDLRIEDLDAVVDLIVRTWQDSYRGLIPDAKLDRMTIENLTPGMRKHFEEPLAKQVTLGVFDGNELLGVSTAGRSRGDFGFDCELWAMNVPLRAQRRGVGKLLLQENLRRMQALGHRSMYLCCIDQNSKALAFYQAMGGRFSGQSADREGYREIVLFWDDLSATRP